MSNRKAVLFIFFHPDKKQIKHVILSKVCNQKLSIKSKNGKSL